jgi:hypothetical protein
VTKLKRNAKKPGELKSVDAPENSNANPIIGEKLEASRQRENRRENKKEKLAPALTSRLRQSKALRPAVATVCESSTARRNREYRRETGYGSIRI